MSATAGVKSATQACIRALGVARCAELCGGITEANVYRWANPNEIATIPITLALDSATWVRSGIAPFREVFEANAGAPLNERVAAELVAAARRIAPIVAHEQ